MRIIISSESHWWALELEGAMLRVSERQGENTLSVDLATFDIDELKLLFAAAIAAAEEKS